MNILPNADLESAVRRRESLKAMAQNGKDNKNLSEWSQILSFKSQCKSN